MAGKGDKRRPTKVDPKQFEENWNRIFAKHKEQLLEQEPPEEAKQREQFCEKSERGTRKRRRRS